MPISAKSAPRIGFSGFPAPYWAAPGVALYLGDVRACLRAMPARSVHCAVTSPPYWGLRSYLDQDHPDKASEIGVEPSPDCGTRGQAQCGCFVCSLVGVFREVYRVLRDDSTVWLNLGDSYSSGSGGNGTTSAKQQSNHGTMIAPRAAMKDIPPGNLVGVPWRVALALQADGWLLRQDIIWYSPNKMPESVTNRCTKSHEHIFLLAKGGDYYYDSVAIEEPSVEPERQRRDRIGGANGHTVRHSVGGIVETAATKNKRDVWIVPTTGYPGAHFATFSSRLITPCILAGTSEYGCCAACGRPWERVVARVGGTAADGDAEARDRSFPSQRNGLPGSGSMLDGVQASRETVGWRKVCGCQTDEVVPAVVLDPFVGSGTTVATALELGRHGVGIDLSEVYLRENAVPRIEAALRGGRMPRPLVCAASVDMLPQPKKLR